MNKDRLIRWGLIGALGVGSFLGIRALINRGENNKEASQTQSTEMANALLEAHGIGTQTESATNEIVQNTPFSSATKTETRYFNGSAYTVTVYADGTECANIDSFSLTGNHVDGAVQVLTYFSQFIEVRGPDGTVIDQFNRVSGSNPQSDNVPIDTDVCVVK